MRVDLQLHSTYSDGYLTPTELVKFIAGKGVKIAALTDHNTVGGVSEFKRACKDYGVKPIVGLELYVKLKNKSFNILWYNLDRKSPELHKMLRDSQTRRRRQVRNILNKLISKGFEIDVNGVLDKYSRYVPINHVVDEIIANKKNFDRIKKEMQIKNPSEGEIINKYFHDKKIGVLRNSYINIDRILKLRKKIDGQIVLCHPAKGTVIKREFWEKLKKKGFDGVEILSPHHSINAIMYMQDMARELDFVVTGGSDFHRFEGNNHLIQNSWEYYKINSGYLRGIKKIIG